MLDGGFSKSILIFKLICVWNEPVNCTTRYFYLRIAQGKAVEFITNKLINYSIGRFLNVPEYMNRQDKMVGLMELMNWEK